MRISDCSSDVCSSDLQTTAEKPAGTTTLTRQLLPWGAGMIVLLLVGLGLIAQLLLVAAPRDSQKRSAKNLAGQQAMLVNFTLDQNKNRASKIGRATCRERGCRNVAILDVAGQL